jgi:hypothetical protein
MYKAGPNVQLSLPLKYALACVSVCSTCWLLPLAAAAGLAMGCVVGEVYALRKDTKSLTGAEWEVRLHHQPHSCALLCHSKRRASSLPAAQCNVAAVMVGHQEPHRA